MEGERRGNPISGYIVWATYSHSPSCHRATQTGTLRTHAHEPTKRPLVDVSIRFHSRLYEGSPFPEAMQPWNLIQTTILRAHGIAGLVSPAGSVADHLILRPG